VRGVVIHLSQPVKGPPQSTTKINNGLDMCHRLVLRRLGSPRCVRKWRTFTMSGVCLFTSNELLKCRILGLGALIIRTIHNNSLLYTINCKGFTIRVCFGSQLSIIFADYSRRSDDRHFLHSVSDTYLDKWPNLVTYLKWRYTWRSSVCATLFLSSGTWRPGDHRISTWQMCIT